MARANSPKLEAAIVAREVAREDRKQARAGLLPTLNYEDQYLYTQGNETPSGRFIANNAVHEYLSQGLVHAPIVDLGRLADYHRTIAAEAVAAAQADVAARGLNATVVESYYAFVVAQRKVQTAQQGVIEAQRFLNNSRALEKAGEVAHVDTIRAELQFEQRQRDVADAQVSLLRARSELAVLIFPQYRENFVVVDDLDTLTPLPSEDQIRQLAFATSPDLRAATAGLSEAQHAVGVARAGYLPTIALDYFYGIDASRFATRTGRIPNLGYAATATFMLPVWNWGTTGSKVHQADLRRQQAQVELSAAQRTLQADVRELYAEADVARGAVATLRHSADLAAQNLRLVNLRYQAGESTVLEVVDAQNSLIQARNALDDGEVRYRTAIANLQTVAGSF
jgi:outer membrane protein TolC